MEKLRQAILGQNGRNLDDLEHMDGTFILICSELIMGHFYRVCSYKRIGVCELPHPEVH